MIKWRDVVVCYEPDGRHPVNALDGVSLAVVPGEWVFFVGPSGAGKSTLLKLVYGGAHAHKGQIWVDGQDVTRLAAREIPLLRRKIGVVFQDFQLLGQKTVWENVAFALQVIGAPQKKLVRDVPRALETVGLSHKADARPHELSGGEAQRVAIARAIVNDPLILIADEPTGNLDPQTASDIAQVLGRINARGTTILMATHDRALVDQMKNRVVRIADGRVLSDQAHGEYHPEDDAIAVVSSAPTQSSNPPQIAAAPVFAVLSNANANAAPSSPAPVKAGPSNVKIHKPVSAFAGQVDASPVADTSLTAPVPHMSTGAVNPPVDASPLAVSTLAVSTTPNTQIPNALAADTPIAAPDPHMSTHAASVQATASSVAASSVGAMPTAGAPAQSQAIVPPLPTVPTPQATSASAPQAVAQPKTAILEASSILEASRTETSSAEASPPDSISAPAIQAPKTPAPPVASAPFGTLKVAPLPTPSPPETSTSPAIAPSRAAGNSESSYHDSIDRARFNQAPIGSPENPIIQLDRAPDVQMPHEVEI